MEKGYKVTALKWRPKKFEDVICQSHITTTLLNAIKSGRVAHAYLFTGPRGVGKTTVARIFARAVNCLSPKDGEPCDECQNCKLSLTGGGLDIIEIDGASNRGIDDMRSLQESARYTPTHGKYKIYIIDEIHMITREGFNAFLKTLEEPPEHVIFIGATTEPIKVFPTIISRCQRFDFKRIPLEEITSRLRYIAEHEGIIIDEESLVIIAKKGDGSMRDSQSIFDQAIAFCGNKVTIKKLSEVMNLIATEYFFKVTDFIKEKNSKAALELIDFLVSRGYDIHEFILGLLDHFRNLIHTVLLGDATSIETSEDYKEKYESEAKIFTEPDLLRMMKILSDFEIDYKKYNQPRLKFEMTLLQIIKMDKTVYISNILQDIENIKKKKLIPDNLNDKAGLSFNSEANANLTKKNMTEVQPSNLTVNEKIKEPLSEPKVKTSAEKKNISVNEITVEEITEKWDEFLEEIKKQSRMNLRAALLSARLLNISDNVLTLAVADTFQGEIIMLNKLFLHEKERAIYGFSFEMNPIVVERKIIENPENQEDKEKTEVVKKENLNTNNQEKSENRGEKKKMQIKTDHPMVQALLDEFEAEAVI